MTGEVYYRVMPHRGRWWKVQIWRWWWPFWVDAETWLNTQEECSQWIKGHSTYYDGAL